jgi:hypothetical protein
MENITSTADIKNAIQLLKAEQDVMRQQLKEQFDLTLEGLNPLNLIRNTVEEISSSPLPINNILVTALGLATGYFTKKIVVGVSGSTFRKLFGTILQIGVANLIARHPDEIKSFSQFILQHIFQRNEVNSETA